MSFLSNGIDAALEWSVVGSFTRIGSAVRRNLDDWNTANPTQMAGRTVVISGATSGLGRAAARDFANMGATVEIIARNGSKAERVGGELKEETGQSNISFVQADTGDLSAIRRIAEELKAKHATIDVLIHNAGALE